MTCRGSQGHTSYCIRLFGIVWKKYFERELPNFQAISSLCTSKLLSQENFLTCFYLLPVHVLPFFWFCCVYFCKCHPRRLFSVVKHSPLYPYLSAGSGVSFLAKVYTDSRYLSKIGHPGKTTFLSKIALSLPLGLLRKFAQEVRESLWRFFQRKNNTYFLSTTVINASF